MANDKDIQIGINTTADTSGAKQAEAALDKVTEATKEVAQAEATGFGRDTAAARRIAALEEAESLAEQAKAVEKLGEATKETALELPALSEADIVAEGVERLGKGSADAAVKSGGLGRALAGLIGEVNLYAAALSLGWQAAKGWIDSQKALNDIADIGVDDIDRLARSANMAAAAEQAAARGAEALAAARRQAEQITRQSTDAEKDFHTALTETIAKETELRRLRDVLADKEMAVELAKAEGDPEAQAAIREKARQAAAARERQDLEADISMQRKIKDQAAAEFLRLDEQESSARGKAGALEGTATTQEQAAAGNRDLAEKMEKQRQDALQRKAAAEELAGNFWTPTVRKNAAKEIIAEETENAAKLEKQREVFKNRATELEGLAKATRTLADAEKQAAENLARRRDAVNETYGEATKEEERLTTTVKPFVGQRQGLEDEAAQALEESRKRAAAAELREKERRAAEQQAEREKSRRNAERDLETDITGLGRDAAEATKGLGASSSINPEGFNTLATKIARKGDPEGDRVDLAAFLEKVSMLVDAIPDSKSSSEEAEKLREVERKIERKVAYLSERISRVENQ